MKNRLIILISGGLLFITICQWLAGHFAKEAVVPSEPYVMEAPAPADQTPFRQMVREPSTPYYLNTVFVGEQEIASFKSDGEKIFGISGTIPDGKIEFKNFALNTSGYEHFDKGLRSGEYVEYHTNGKLWLQKQYHQGVAVKIKEFFSDGQSVCMNADYSNMMRECHAKDNGSGIVYRHPGQKMYEWHLTGLDANRYKKFYDNLGKLMMTEYFDGKCIRQKIVKAQP